MSRALRAPPAAPPSTSARSASYSSSADSLLSSRTPTGRRGEGVRRAEGGGVLVAEQGSVEPHHRQAGELVVHGPQRHDQLPRAGGQQSAGQADEIAGRGGPPPAAVAGAEHGEVERGVEAHEVGDGEATVARQRHLGAVRGLLVQQTVRRQMGDPGRAQSGENRRPVGLPCEECLRAAERGDRRGLGGGAREVA